MAKNIIALAGLDTIKDPDTHKVKGFSSCFYDNMLTVKHDNPGDNVAIIDARKFRDDAEPMPRIWRLIQTTFERVDALIIGCHSDQEGLYIISKYRKGEIADNLRYIEFPFNWDGVPWGPGAYIRLDGCQTGGRNGKKWETCIAQDIANKTGLPVLAFCYKSSQQRRADGHYYQKPERGTHVKFERIKRDEPAS